VPSCRNERRVRRALAPWRRGAMVEVSTHGVAESPVQVAPAWIRWAGIAAAHRRDAVRRQDNRVGYALVCLPGKSARQSVTGAVWGQERRCQTSRMAVHVVYVPEGVSYRVDFSEGPARGGAVLYGETQTRTGNTTIFSRARSRPHT